MDENLRSVYHRDLRCVVDKIEDLFVVGT